MFRIVLSHSRKGYAEAVYRQTTDDFCAALENAFARFGGVPRTLVIDNLRAAVSRADWFDPELCPKVRSLRRALRHRHPAHQAVHAAAQGEDRTGHRLREGQRPQGADLRFAGRAEPASAELGDERRRHAHPRHDPPAGQGSLRAGGEAGTAADARWRGSICSRRRCGACIATGMWRSREPTTRCRRSFWASGCGRGGTGGRCGCWIRRCVRSPCTRSARREHSPRSAVHILPEKISGIERGTAWLLRRVECIGPHATQWAQAMLQNRGIEGVRVLMGLFSLANKHHRDRIEPACQMAQGHGAYHLRSLRQLIEQQNPRHGAAELRVHSSSTRSSAAWATTGSSYVKRSRRRHLPPINPLYRSPAMRPSLLQTLKQLRLSGLAQSLEVRLTEAAGNRLDHAEFLELILQDELNVRSSRQVDRRVKSACFSEVKNLDEFDFSFNPSIKRKQIHDLASCQFIRDKADVLLLGPPGVGKTFLVQAIGHQAIKAGFLVLYRSIFDLARDFLATRNHRSQQDRMLSRYLKPDLLIIDDMGMKQLPRRSGECLLEIIMRRHENRSTMMTSNRPAGRLGQADRRRAGRHRHPRPLPAARHHHQHHRQELPSAAGGAWPTAATPRPKQQIQKDGGVPPAVKGAPLRKTPWQIRQYLLGRGLRRRTSQFLPIRRPNHRAITQGKVAKESNG